MLTAFGREVRKYRIDKHMTLKQMAEQLEVKSSYLSSVESGRKPLSPELLRGIIRILELSPPDQEKLEKVAADTQKSIQLDVSNESPRHRELATAFARRFDNLSDTQINNLLAIIRETDGKRGARRG